MKREECECDLQFAGFVVIACPLKNDSKAAIKQIQESSHHVRTATQIFSSIKNLTIVHVYKQTNDKPESSLFLIPNGAGNFIPQL